MVDLQNINFMEDCKHIKEKCGACGHESCTCERLSGYNGTYYIECCPKCQSWMVKIYQKITVPRVVLHVGSLENKY